MMVFLYWFLYRYFKNTNPRNTIIKYTYVMEHFDSTKMVLFRTINVTIISVLQNYSEMSITNNTHVIVTQGLVITSLAS